MAERRSKVTMLDIARASGLSLSTVSLALNDKPGLPPDTRLKVQKTARELGYEIRVPVSMHKPSLVQTVGVLVNCDEYDASVSSSNLFFSHVIAGIEAGCYQHNIALFYSTHPPKKTNNGSDLPRLIHDSRIDGLLLLGNHVDDTLFAAIRQCSLPFVLVEAYSDRDDYDSVQVDNEEGSRLAVEHLIQQGHRHIAFLGGFPDSRGSLGIRRQSYVQALANHGISTAYFGDCQPNNREEIIAASRRLILENPPVSAIFGCSDEVTVIGMHGVMEAGKSIPAEVSIIGFENNAIAENAIPPMTTIHVDKMGLGRLAVQLLINRAENPLQGFVTTRMHTSLVKRHSVLNIEAAVPA